MTPLSEDARWALRSLIDCGAILVRYGGMASKRYGELSRHGWCNAELTEHGIVFRLTS